ncbi:MAG: arsenite methyltransferase [Chloroflexota bacterium]|nr:arsenite methyltransferase [Chloroflexota bacterium]
MSATRTGAGTATRSGETVDDTAKIRETVREKYGDIARDVLGGAGAIGDDPITGDLYSRDEARVIPVAALQASLGCGNPTALAELKSGETVLDLGSGGGIDVLLSARRVGPEGFAYGLDMTDEMLALAEQNRKTAGAENVSFLKGEIEAIPLPDNAVDVIISNCVINLSADKGQVLREAFRVLRPGGRFAVSDVVAQGELPDDLRSDMEAWVGCVAGALEEGEYRRLLTEAGFGEIDLEVTRVYDPHDLRESAGGGCCGSSGGCCGDGGAMSWDEDAYGRFAASGGRMVSAFVRATKPN